MIISLSFVCVEGNESYSTSAFEHFVNILAVVFSLTLLPYKGMSQQCARDMYNKLQKIKIVCRYCAVGHKN